MKSASALPSSNSAGDAVAQVASVAYSGGQPKEKDDRWCFAMTTDANCHAVKGSVLIDSGSDEHVSRKEFAPAYETQPDPHPVTLRDVQKGFLQQYGVRDVSLQIGPSGITAAQCAFKVADVNDDVLSLGRLLRRGFEFDLSLGRGCSMFPQGRPDKAVPLFLHNNSLRLQALPSVRAISDCRPVGMEMGAPAPTDPEVHARGRERRDEVHGDRLLPVAALGPNSPLRALRAQFAELGRPTYGSKYHCWKRLRTAHEARAESEAVARHEEAMAVGGADVQVPARPVEPLSEERERHNVSHLPPQPWCEHCVRGRAPEGDHKRVTFEQADKELPVIAFDFAFLKTSQGSERTTVADAYATQLVAVDVGSGMIRVIPAPGKNVSDYLVTGLRKFVESTFHKKVRLRCDNEPAAIIIAERVKALLPDVVVLENTPRHDHAANPAERAIRSVEDQVRVLRLDVEARYGIQVSANMSLWPWIARHAGWLLTRCKIKGNVCTPYQDAYGTKYSGEMNIAETVLFRFPYPEHRRTSGKRTLHKGDSVWERGIWCGRSEDTGEHILHTTDGRVLARTVRRLPVGSGTDIALLRESIGTPWDPMLGTVVPEKNIPMPVPEVFRREVVPLIQEAEPPIVKTRNEGQTVEPKQEQEQERGKNLPAEASPSSAEPGTSDHDTDAPMTDDEARGRLRERDDEQQDPPRRKRYKQVGKLTVDEDPADYLGDAGELDWSEERLLETDRVETEKALDQLLEQGVVQDVPADSVEGVKHLTTRWEKSWRMREGKWKYKVRFVGREYKWQAFREDLFAPGASHCTSRIIDYLALKKGYTTFAFDAIDAYFQAPETENIVVDPPLEYLKRLEEAGGDTNIKWKLLKQLPGRRPAGQRWVDHLAGILVNELGFTRSSRSPQFYWSQSRQVAMEVHMDDISMGAVWMNLWSLSAWNLGRKFASAVRKRVLDSRMST